VLLNEEADKNHLTFTSQYNTCFVSANEALKTKHDGKVYTFATRNIFLLFFFI